MLINVINLVIPLEAFKDFEPKKVLDRLDGDAQGIVHGDVVFCSFYEVYRGKKNFDILVEDLIKAEDLVRKGEASLLKAVTADNLDKCQLRLRDRQKKLKALQARKSKAEKTIDWVAREILTNYIMQSTGHDTFVIEAEEETDYYVYSPFDGADEVSCR